jgi:bla regulator protein blaR1
MQLLFLSQWFSDEMLKAMCWTLAHSLWQGLLAAVAAGIIIISTRKSSARLRYNLLGVLLILFLTTVAFTMREQVQSFYDVQPAAASLIGESNDRTTTVTVQPDPISVPGAGSAGRIIKFLDDNASLIMLLWTLFFLINCSKILAGVAGVHRLRTRKTHTTDEWQTKLDQLSQAIGIYQSIRLLQSELVKVPVAIGFFKPVILVPLGLLSHLPPDQVETILLHELAHIRRRDYLMNILQRFAEAVFFFNPALLWISSLIRQEREACCDDIVVANTTHKGSYLEALVSFQEYSLATSGYAMGISSKKHYLLNRVKRMLTRENKKLDLMEKILLIIGVTVVSAFTFMPNKDATAQQQPVRQSVKRAEEKSETFSLATPSSASVSNPVLARKMTVSKPPVKPGSPVAVKDTVPPQKAKEQTKTSSSEQSSGSSNEQLSVQSTSTNVNSNGRTRTSTTIVSDGKTKTVTTTFVDQDGKSYSISRLNDKITNLSVDGKTIPENEMSQYSSIIDKIDRVVEDNNEEKRKQREARNDERMKKNEERGKERAMAMSETERIKMKQKFEKEKENREKEHDRQKKENDKRKADFEKQRKELENERKKMAKERDEDRKQMVKEREKNLKEMEKRREEDRKVMEKEREKNRKEME